MLTVCVCADAIPLRSLPLNKVPFVPKNMPLLGILDKFQEGRSHMAIVSRLTVDLPPDADVVTAAKKGLTQRIKDRVGMGDSSDDEDDVEKGKQPETAPAEEKAAPAERKGTWSAASARKSTLWEPREQATPADAVLAPAGFQDFLQGIDPAVMPIGIITLEDVLEGAPSSPPSPSSSPFPFPIRLKLNADT